MYDLSIRIHPRLENIRAGSQVFWYRDRMERLSICARFTLILPRSFLNPPRSHEERKEAIQLTRKTLDDNGFQNVLVIAGTGAQSTRETKKLCVDARDSGASHVLVLTPSTWPPQMSVENIIRFHREASPCDPVEICMLKQPKGCRRITDTDLDL